MTNRTYKSRALPLAIGAIAMVAVCAAAWWAFTVLRSPGSQRLRPVRGVSASCDLPSGMIILHLADAPKITAPFEIRPDVGANSGAVLTLPEAGGANNNKGHAIISFATDTGGDYVAWARTKWHDSCANSLVVTIDHAPHYNVGQDSVYNQWHWVPAGKYRLEEGEHKLELLGREDGIAIDQLLLTTDDSFVPGEVALDAFSTWEARRFADDFARSPGHGLGEWDVTGTWRIGFTLDPNRIPYQYALIGTSTNGVESVAMARSMPWRGFFASFSILTPGPAKFGMIFDHWTNSSNELRIELQIDENETANLRLIGSEMNTIQDISSVFKADQWHRVVVERWAWLLRVYIDDRIVLSRADLTPNAGRVGVFVAEGTAVIDDVDITSIPWVADDDTMRTVPWRVPPDSRWYRSDNFALLGRGGPIELVQGRLPVDELIIDSSNCQVLAPGLKQATHAGAKSFTAASTDTRLSTISLLPKDGEARIKRIAVKFNAGLTDVYRIGPYHFSEAKVEDPSDYVDFTEDEYRQMKESKDAEKLRRKKKYVPLLSGGRDKNMWRYYGGRWVIDNGVLIGKGPYASVVHTREVLSDVDVNMRLQLVSTNSCAEVLLYSHRNQSANVRIVSTVLPMTQDTPLLQLSVGGSTNWHNLHMRFCDGTLYARVDNLPWKSATFTKHSSGRFLLRSVVGEVRMDDVELLIPRKTPKQLFYAFDRREPDWRRDGGQWIDHAGVACAISSSWISLIAPTAKGVIWNKHTFNGNVTVAFSVQENTEWFGWDQHPSHTHYPFDNIQVFLATERDAACGYRLEINSRDRTATVLYRNGEEVAVTQQGIRFPIRYGGGHSPYWPRTTRIAFLRKGAELIAMVNGKQVLTFTDPEPLPVSCVGIGGYNTRINFTNIEVLGERRGGELEIRNWKLETGNLELLLQPRT